MVGWDYTLPFSKANSTPSSMPTVRPVRCLPKVCSGEGAQTDRLDTGQYRGSKPKVTEATLQVTSHEGGKTLLI